MDAQKFRAEIDKISGQFISRMSMLESILANVICYHIGGKLNYCMFILTKIDMPTKLKLYDQIVKDGNTRFKKHTYHNITNEIQALQNIRNLFAHGIPDYEEKSIYIGSEDFNLVNFKELSHAFALNQKFAYSLQKGRDDINKIMNICKTLHEISKEYAQGNPSQ